MNATSSHPRRITLRDTLMSLGIMLAAALLCLALQRLDATDVYVSMIFVLAVFLISRLTDGYIYGIVASFFSVCA